MTGRQFPPGPTTIARRSALTMLAGGAATSVLAGCSAYGGGQTIQSGRETMTTDLSGGLPVEREYFYHAKPDPEVRDAANIWLEEVNGAFGMRIGIEHVAEMWDTPEYWLDIAFPDGRVLSGREFGAGEVPLGPDGKPTLKRCGPMLYECIEPFKHWKVSYGPHKIRDLTMQQLRMQDVPAQPPMSEVAFEVEFFPAVPPLISGTLTAASREMMAGKQGSFISPRYEQLCSAKGWLSVDGQRREFDANVLRIKRQGVRKFAGFWGHCWASAIFPSGKAFGFNTFPPRGDGSPTFNEGFIFDGSGVLIPARAIEIPWLHKLWTGGEPVRIVLETEDGRRETITGQTYVNCRSVHNSDSFDPPPDWPIVQQSHATYTWGDETATGMLERSTVPSKMDLEGAPA
jgi:hypothetical protein